MWKFSKRFLAIFMLLCVVCLSCSALAFLPSYSTSSQEEDTGFMSLLRSMTSKKSDASSTPEDEEEAVGTLPEKEPNEDGFICFTEDEVAEMDKLLAHAEKELEDELDPFHFGIGASLGYTGLTVLKPSLDWHFRWDDFLLNMSVAYPFDLADDAVFSLDPLKIDAKVGIMWEF